MQIKPLLRHTLRITFVAAILILLVVGTFTYRETIVVSESDRWVRHTHEVLENLQDLLASSQNIESSYRGFALTGDESYYETYRASVVRAARVEGTVAALTADNPAQQQRIPVLKSLMEQKVQFGETVIGLRRTNGLQAAADAVRDGQGQQIGNRFEGLIRDMQNEEMQLLVLRETVAKQHSRETQIILLLGTGIGVLIAASAAWGALRDRSARVRAEDSRRDGDERFLTLANNISQLAWMADERGDIFWYNDRWFDYTGTTLDEMAGFGWQKVQDPDHVERVTEKISKCFKTGEIWDDTFPLRGKDGKYRSFLSRAVPIRDAKGKVLRWFGTNTDISGIQSMEDAIFAEKERAQVTLNSIGDAVICTDAAGNVSYLNLVAEKMTGWTLQDAAGHPMAEIFQVLDASSRQVVPNPMELAVLQDRTMALPLNSSLVRRDGIEIPIEDSVSPIHDRQGKAAGAVIVFRDASEARAVARQMTYSAQHDFLTGLPNRMLLNDRVGQAIILALRHLKKVAVLFLDLDGFKHINDSLGHPVGDKLLQSISRRLVDCVRGADTVSRQGGDEFVVLLSEVEHSEDAAVTARRMLQAIAEVHPIDEHDLHVTTSIGLSVFPDDGLDAQTLIKNADTAMYQAKESGRQGYQFFKPAMNVRAVERQSIEESLRRALRGQEFALHYQPKINLKTGEITGAEALLRWTHPTRGLVSPAEFIPVAEDSGLMLPIGNWALREACKQAQAWVQQGLPSVTMAVNVSAIEFRSRHFLESIFAILEETALDPRSLEIELTESVLMRNAESTSSVLNLLKAKGIRIAVDDFGTGYSSLTNLRKFPIDALKIDESFVRQITSVPFETTIVAAVISMGRSLELRVVAEGVETQEEVMFLQNHQCHEAQGYYFSRPVAPDQYAILLKTGMNEAIPH